MAEKEYIEREALQNKAFGENHPTFYDGQDIADWYEKCINETPAADVAPVRHGRWIYEVHKENTNFRWNVTAECSECCDNRKEIWGGFFPNVPDCIARDVALQSAKQIKLDNYCPHCGAKLCRGE